MNPTPRLAHYFDGGTVLARVVDSIRANDPSGAAFHLGDDDSMWNPDFSGINIQGPAYVEVAWHRGRGLVTTITPLPRNGE